MLAVDPRPLAREGRRGADLDGTIDARRAAAGSTCICGRAAQCGRVLFLDIGGSMDAMYM